MTSDVSDPGDHDVLIDDKLRIPSAVKAIWSDALPAVLPREGHDALDPPRPQVSARGCDLRLAGKEVMEDAIGHYPAELPISFR
jgi:hypothetical protein